MPESIFFPFPQRGYVSQPRVMARAARTGISVALSGYPGLTIKRFPTLKAVAAKLAPSDKIHWGAYLKGPDDQGKCLQKSRFSTRRARRARRFFRSGGRGEHEGLADFHQKFIANPNSAC